METNTINKEIRLDYVPKDLRKLTLEMREAIEKDTIEIIKNMGTMQSTMLLIENLRRKNIEEQFLFIITLTTFKNIDIYLLNHCSSAFLNRTVDFDGIKEDNENLD
jgi:hypothetical protein